MPADRCIFHVDMDAFFASVEQRDDPSLRGQPVLVGHDGPRGVVAAASYESRAFGCRSAQPVAVAKRLCPHAVIVPPHFWRYREASAAVFRIFERFTPCIEPLSIDEAFLDLTGCLRLLGPPREVAARLKAEVRGATGLTASVGVAPNKFLAKLASDLHKPDGLTVIIAGEAEAVLAPLPVGKIWGVGPRTLTCLEGIGVRTIGDLIRVPAEVLSRRVGTKEAERYRRLARGLDDRPVVPDHEAKSIGQEQTFGQDATDPSAVLEVMLEQAEQVAARLRRHRLRARTVTVKIRYGDFQTITRRTTLPSATDVTRELWETARALFDRWTAASFHPVRLIGTAASDFSAGVGQLPLFPDPVAEKQRKLDAAVDRINQRFGRAAIHRSRGGGAGGSPSPGAP